MSTSDLPQSRSHFLTLPKPTRPQKREQQKQRLSLAGTHTESGCPVKNQERTLGEAGAKATKSQQYYLHHELVEPSTGETQKKRPKKAKKEAKKNEKKGHPQEQGSSSTLFRHAASSCQKQGRYQTRNCKRPCTAIASSSTSCCSCSSAFQTLPATAIPAPAPLPQLRQNPLLPQLPLVTTTAAELILVVRDIGAPGRNIGTIMASSSSSEPSSTSRAMRSEAGADIAGTKAEHPVRLGSGRNHCMPSSHWFFSVGRCCSHTTPSSNVCSPSRCLIIRHCRLLQLPLCQCAREMSIEKGCL